jgi:replicative DNA helicase
MDEAMPRRNGNGRDRGAGGRDLQKLFDRLPPNAPEAEMALLGSMILDPNVIDEVLQLVTSGDAFYSESHAAIFDAMRDLHARTQSGDLVQLAGMLKDGGVLDGIGGADYLASLAEQVPTAVNAVHYARIVRDKAQLRNLIDAAGQIIYDAYHAGEHEEDGGRAVIDNAERRVFEIAERNASMDDETLEELLNRTMDMLEANEGRVITGIATGYADLDEKTSGLQPGELLILAARPSMGKTALALNLAEQVAFGGSPYAEHGPSTPVGFFSMEMSKSALAQRLLCARAGVDSHRLRTNRLRKEDFQSLMEAAGMLSQAPLYIDDTPGLTVMQLRAKARRMVARHDVKCIFVDYLQLMSAPSSSRDGRQQEVSAISRGIKALARDLEIPIVCLAQLNRGAEQREGHRPRMADLRESGSIEQDADVIALLHREAYYHVGDNEWMTENEDKINLAELIIAKQRNGPTGVVKLTWEAQTTRFRTYAGYGYADDTPSYSSAAGASYGGAESIEPKPDVAGRVGFAPGSKSGPETDFRDGGGPDRDEWGDDGDEPAPF